MSLAATFNRWEPVSGIPWLHRIARLDATGAGPVNMTVRPIMRTGGSALVAVACGAALHAAISASGPANAGPAPTAQSRCVDILDHDGDRSGRGDNAAAFQAAVAASDPAAVCIRFPAGTYRFASPAAVTLPAGAAYGDAAITISGDGAGLSRLKFDAGSDGVVLRLNGPRQSFQVRDLSILADGRRPNTTGLDVSQANASSSNPAQSDVTRVAIRGSDGFGVANRFARGLRLHQVSNVTLTGTTIAGSPDGAAYATEGLCVIAEGTSTAIPVQINIVASQINHCGRGFVYGPFLQGVQIVASNFTGNGTAIHQPAGNVGNDQLSITASQFNSGLHDILMEAPIDGVAIGASHFYLAESGSAAISLRGVQFAIHGNTFHQFGRARTTAIAIGPFVLDAGVITGNSFNNFATAVLLHPLSSRVNVQNNAYSDIASGKVVDKGKGNTVGGGSM